MTELVGFELRTDRWKWGTPYVPRIERGNRRIPGRDWLREDCALEEPVKAREGHQNG